LHVKVKIDSERCEGYGICAAIVPAVFLLDKLGYAYVAGDGTVPAESVKDAREAVASCPMNAIIADD
jgi:ferredoxin